MIIVLMLVCLGVGFLFGGVVAWLSAREQLIREGYTVEHHPEVPCGQGRYVVRRVGHR